MPVNTYSSCLLHTVSEIALGRNAFHNVQRLILFGTVTRLQPITALSQWLYGIYSTCLLMIYLAWFRYIISFFRTLLIVPWFRSSLPMDGDSLQRRWFFTTWKLLEYESWALSSLDRGLLNNPQQLSNVHDVFCPIFCKYTLVSCSYFYHVKISWFPLIC